MPDVVFVVISLWMENRLKEPCAVFGFFRYHFIVNRRRARYLVASVWAVPAIHGIIHNRCRLEALFVTGTSMITICYFFDLAFLHCDFIMMGSRFWGKLPTIKSLQLDERETDHKIGGGTTPPPMALTAENLLRFLDALRRVRVRAFMATIMIKIFEGRKRIKTLVYHGVSSDQVA